MPQYERVFTMIHGTLSLDQLQRLARDSDWPVQEVEFRVFPMAKYGLTCFKVKVPGEVRIILWHNYVTAAMTTKVDSTEYPIDPQPFLDAMAQRGTPMVEDVDPEYQELQVAYLAQINNIIKTKEA